MIKSSVRAKMLAMLACAAIAMGCGHSGSPAVASQAPEARCAAIAALADSHFLVREAQFVADGVVHIPFPPPGAGITTKPHCLIKGAINPRIGEGGRPFEIGFELRMPVEWNGRFLFQGGGGLDGFIQPALGSVAPDAPSALAQAFAVVSTDAGHQGGDASFASDPQARIDYAYNALEVVARKAKTLIARFYGEAAQYSYFVGCSNGGRQGMIAAERFPDLFNGVVAGDPGFRLSRAAVGEMWDNAQFARVAPRDADGRAVISQAFSEAELRLVADAVLSRCDDLDGLADGFINNRAACRFDPAVLQCAGASTDRCLPSAKVAALRAIFGGARNSQGQALYASWPYDTGVAEPGWRVWKLGSSPTGAANGINQTMGQDAFTRYFATPPITNFDYRQFDFDQAASLVAQTGAINDAVSTNMSAWNGAGGKMIIYQGVSDPVFSADDIQAWYEQAAASPAGAASTRLFMVPGMNHCAGGHATDQFDAFAALQNWVEHGRAPERIVAHGAALPGATRPLCPYPAHAHYTGGDANSEASFVCRAP